MRGLLNQCDISMIDSVFTQNLFTDTCIVYSKGQRTQTDFGSSYTETSKKYPCKITKPSSDDEKLSGDKVDSLLDVVIILPLSASSIRPKDRIVSDSITYEIIATDKGISDTVCLEVYARKID